MNPLRCYSSGIPKGPICMAQFLSIVFIKSPFLVCIMLFSTAVYAGEPDEKSLRAVFRPVFETTEGEHAAGTAFVLKYKGGYYAVTAHHIFGEAGGFSREYAWDELHKLVQKVTLRSLGDEKIQYSAPLNVMIGGAKALSMWTAKHDIAVFWIPEKPKHHLTLAEEHPKVGDYVWLYAEVGGSDALLHKAVVEQYTQDSLIYGFINKQLMLGGSSGAAMLNEKGEVVGINVGGWEKSGRQYGEANPLISLQSLFKTYVRSATN